MPTMKFFYSIDIIGKQALFEVLFGTRPPRYVIKTQAGQFKLLRILAGFCRTVLQNPARDG